MARRRRRRMGVRGRVVTSFLVLLVTAEVISIAVLHQVGEARLTEQVGQEMADATGDFRARLQAAEQTQPAGVDLQVLFRDFLRARPTRQDESYLTFVDGQPFAASAGAPVALVDLDVASRWATIEATTSGEVDTAAGPMRWLAVPVLNDGVPVGVLVTTAFLADQQAALQGTVVTVSVVTGLILLGACLLAWGAAGRALQPLRDLAGTARSVTTGDDLTARIAVATGDEVGELAESFNGMLDRLQGAFDSQKQFLDDAGHELRTPITIVRGHLELLDPDPERQAEEIAVALDELDRMDRLVRDLRVVARSGRPDFLVLEDLDVPTFLDGVARKAEAMAERRWSVHRPAPARMRGDQHRLTEALLNLVDNAVEVTGPGDVLELGADLRGGEVELYVRDHGPGIPAEEVAHLFDRRVVTGPRRPGSTGLGLPIVAAIATAHGGCVAVETAAGEGSCFRVKVPALVGAPA